MSPAPLGTRNPRRASLSALLAALINFKWHRVLGTMTNGALRSFKVIFGVSDLFANQEQRGSQRKGFSCSPRAGGAHTEPRHVLPAQWQLMNKIILVFALTRLASPGSFT